jgi:hypothetical protein
MTALRRGTFALAAAVILPLTARAADLPLIRVFPPTCASAPVSIEDFVDSLRVELAGRQPHCCVLGPSDNPAADAVKVTLAVEPCDPATQDVVVTVDVGTPTRTIVRPVTLGDLPPEARARALALAVAELIRSAGEPAVVNDTTGPPPGPPAEGPVAPSKFVSETAVAELRLHPRHDTWLWGFRLGGALSSARWQIGVDAGGALGRSEFSQGNVKMTQLSGGLFAGPRWHAGWAVIDAGATASFGRVWITGERGSPDVGPQSGAGFVALAGVRAAVEDPGWSMLRARATIEAGMTLLGLEATVDGRPAAGVSGPYVVFGLGIRFGAAEPH